MFWLCLFQHYGRLVRKAFLLSPVVWVVVCYQDCFLFLSDRSFSLIVFVVVIWSFSGMLFFRHQVHLQLFVTHELLKLITVFSAIINNHGLFFKLNFFGIIFLKIPSLGLLTIRQGIANFIGKVFDLGNGFDLIGYVLLLVVKMCTGHHHLRLIPRHLGEIPRHLCRVSCKIAISDSEFINGRFGPVGI